MKSTNKVKYRELVRLFRNLRGKQLHLLFFCMLSTVLELYFVYQIQEFVDLAVSKAPWQEVLKEFGRIGLTGLLAFGAGLYQTRVWHVFRYTLMNQMRTMMYGKLLKKQAVFFDERTTGDIVSAVMNDGSLIAESAGISVLMLVLNMTKIVIIIGVLLARNLLLGSVEILVGTLYFLAVNRINKKMRENYQAFSQETANLNQHLTEDTRAVLEIKTLNEKEFFEKRFHSHVWENFFQAAKRIIRLDVCSYGVNSLISIIFPVFMVLLGSVFLYRGEITVGCILLFYTYTQKLVEPLNNMADFYRGTQRCVGAADRIYEYLMPEETMEGVRIAPEEDTRVELDIRRFAWKEQDILTDIHASWQSGDKVFIEGESGSGKTTLLKLICGFYPVTEGMAKICGRDAHTIPEEELFDLLKIQFQEPVILEGTLRENVVLGGRYEDREILQILELVQLKEFALTHGLDYQIQESGGNLSGGQKQRLALARVLIRRPRILIMDEATNGLDAENERIILENIERFVAENGSILIVTSHKDGLRKICNKKLSL